jgi:acyl-CoA synthetase (AMP-forming)/AMP-acid ligase II
MAASLSEEHGPPVPTNLPTCWQKFRDLVDNHPQDLALVSMHQPAGLYGIENVVIDNQAYQKQPYLRWDYQNLGRAVDRLSTGLQHLGAQAGMALITFMPNCVERMLAVLAADKLGCPFTAISPKNLINMEETAHMLKLCKTNASKTGMILIAQDTSLVEQINTLVVGDSAIKLLVNGEATGWTSMGTVMKVQEHHRKDSFTNGRSESSTQGHEPNDESVFFTSGTTNLPKGKAFSTSIFYMVGIDRCRLSMGAPTAQLRICSKTKHRRLCAWRSLGLCYA